MIRTGLFIILLFISYSLTAQNGEYLSAKLLSGEGAYAYLERHGLDRSNENLKKFKEINSLSKLSLFKDKSYKLPIKVYKYNGKSIRTTIGIVDYDYAVMIQKYNERMVAEGIKKGDYRKDNILWVPEKLPESGKTAKTSDPGASKLKGTFPLFGKEYEDVELKSNKLTGHVYYVVAGHGGPDPGAVVTYGGHTLCEDEYAYDVTLRLAKRLLANDATVYIIINSILPYIYTYIYILCLNTYIHLHKNFDRKFQLGASPCFASFSQF